MTRVRRSAQLCVTAAHCKGLAITDGLEEHPMMVRRSGAVSLAAPASDCRSNG